MSGYAAAMRDDRDLFAKMGQWFRERPWSVGAWIVTAVLVVALLVWFEQTYGWPDALKVSPFVRNYVPG